ncbi:hypothetical protein [Streptomyces sp. NBC_01446]|uniref:hypothetical protein n=1 Tax=Streptomyces sp. NBC_01446 TaxID=2903870 RepID=UPI002254D1BA|nr:hypothetical protein [Streptomyces sp. NBC_01446]MCX4648083.1 hypothetical protein [Streptomyces sp. NBC_01446]
MEDWSDCFDPAELRIRLDVALEACEICPPEQLALNCGYCVRHLFENYGMKVPRRLMSDEDAVNRLVSHPYFRPHAASSGR